MYPHIGALGRTYACDFTERSQVRCRDTWLQALASEGPGEDEARMHRYDGSYRWLPFQSQMKAPLKIPIVHRLAEVTDHSVPYRLIPDGFIGVCGNEYRRDRVSQID